MGGKMEASISPAILENNLEKYFEDFIKIRSKRMLSFSTTVLRKNGSSPCKLLQNNRLKRRMKPELN
jgi:hypothetical protein